MAKNRNRRERNHEEIDEWEDQRGRGRKRKDTNRHAQKRFHRAMKRMNIEDIETYHNDSLEY